MSTHERHEEQSTLIITLEPAPSEKLSSPEQLAENRFKRLKEVLTKYSTHPNPFYEQVWIEAIRENTVIGYALIDLFTINKKESAPKGTPVSEVKHCIDALYEGHNGVIRVLELSSYDYEAMEEIKAAIDLLLWKRGVELEMDQDYLFRDRVSLRTYSSRE